MATAALRALWAYGRAHSVRLHAVLLVLLLPLCVSARSYRPDDERPTSAETTVSASAVVLDAGLAPRPKCTPHAGNDGDVPAEGWTLPASTGDGVLLPVAPCRHLPAYVLTAGYARGPPHIS